MEVHMYSSANAMSQPGKIWDKDIKTTKTPKPEENQLGILKIYSFCQEIQHRALGPGDSTAGVMYLPMRVHQKKFDIFPRKVVTTLHSGSRKGATGA